ncbi:MAG TPA: hypothetical protein VFG86_23770 [Chloroflexota bacterium]|nr:hypothetical protein [Chloroflexota bacterium]
MHAERFPATTHAQQRDDARELLALLAGYRRRLGAEVLSRYLVRGAIVAGLLLAMVFMLSWLLGQPTQPLALWLALLVPLLGAVALAVTAWPSHSQTARVADGRLRLDERVATAVELSRPRPSQASGRFDALQVHDALARLRVAPRSWGSPEGARRTELLLMLFAVALAVLSMLLPLLPRPGLDRAQEAPASGEIGAAVDERLIPPEDLDMRINAAPEAQQAQPPDANLAPRVQAAQAEQESLDNLAQALNGVSATRAAADAIQRGDFSGARDQLNTLAEEADQLSEAAKRQLSRALANAASGAGADRQLAERERQAAQALGRNNYADQRQALRQLADQVERSGGRSMSQSQMARDVGRLQQQQATAGSSQGQSQSPSGGAPNSGVQAQQGAAGGGVNSESGGQSQGGGSTGEQGGPGAGSGSTDGVGDPAGRLATSGQMVEVPTKLSSGDAQRPADGSEDQVGANPGMGGRTVAEAAQTQHTGQLTPEQNLVPSEQRPVVRGYFR